MAEQQSPTCTGSEEGDSGTAEPHVHRVGGRGWRDSGALRVQVAL